MNDAPYKLEPRIAGLSPDSETYTNEHGGKQSKTSYDFSLLDPMTMGLLAAEATTRGQYTTAREAVAEAIYWAYRFLGERNVNPAAKAALAAMDAVALADGVLLPTLRARGLVDFSMLPPHSMFRLASVALYGANKYGKDNWRSITPEENANHLIGHAYGWLAGDEADDHLGHMLMRSHMLVASVLKAQRENRDV